MKLHICRLSFLLALVALLGPNAGFVPAGGQGKVDEIEKKLQAVRQQVEELRKQEQALLQQRELEQQKRKAEDEERKKRYVRVEIRGILSKQRLDVGEDRLKLRYRWHVTINELVWTVSLGEKNEHLAAAEKLNGKTVVITGRLLTVTAPPRFLFESESQPPTTVAIESLRLAEKGPENLPLNPERKVP